MSTDFRISYDWLTNDYGDPAVDSTIAALGIIVGPWSGTEVEDTLAKTVRLSARLSALRLSEWFAANWWRLLWEPKSQTLSWRASHRMGNVGHGYVWPDLTFDTDWESIHIVSRPTLRREAEPIRYLNHFDCHVPLRDFETGVEEFINGTIARLSHVQDARSGLGLLWEDVLIERADPASSELRMLEACMGYDPDEAPIDLLERLHKEMTRFGRNAIKELAVAYRLSPIPNLPDLWGMARQDGLLVHVPRYDVIRALIKDESDHLRVPWKRAERAALMAREAWSLNPPVSTEHLCELLQISQASYQSNQDQWWGSLLAGFRDESASDKFRILLSKRYSASRRFGLVRLVADHIIADDDDSLLPATGSRTSRQKFQRTFAQELLCPFDALDEYLGTTTPDGDDIDDAARYFDVSPLLIRTTLVNKGVLGRETLDD